MRDLKLILAEHLLAVESLDLDWIHASAKIMTDAIEGGGKIMICGCGGSAADAQHFAAELVGRFKAERTALPAFAMTTDSSIMSAISNDYHFSQVYAQQIEALGKRGDVLVAISTSGMSPAVVRAIRLAQIMEMKVVGLTGLRGEEAFKKLCHAAIVVQSDDVARVQEAHELALHMIAQLIDDWSGS